MWRLLQGLHFVFFQPLRVISSGLDEGCNRYHVIDIGMEGGTEDWTTNTTSEVADPAERSKLFQEGILLNEGEDTYFVSSVVVFSFIGRKFVAGLRTCLITLHRRLWSVFKRTNWLDILSRVLSNSTPYHITKEQQRMKVVLCDYIALKGCSQDIFLIFTFTY